MPQDTPRPDKVFNRLVQIIETNAQKLRVIPYALAVETLAVEVMPRLKGSGSFGESDVAQAVRALESEHPRLFRRDPNPPPPAEVDRTITIHGLKLTPPNPFKAESRNLDSQVWLETHKPDLARRLKFEAIAEQGSYHGLAALDSWATLSLQKRQALANHRFEEGQGNPYLEGGKKSDQVRLEQQDPALAEQLQQEAAFLADRSGPGGNPWRPQTWNLTRQGKIHRRDPELAETLKQAAELEAQEIQREADEAAAKAKAATEQAEALRLKAQGRKHSSAA